MTYSRRIKRQRNRRKALVERWLKDAALLVYKSLPSMLQTTEKPWFTLTMKK